MILTIGQKIPDILGKNQKGEIVKASDFKDKNLIIYFYPKDSTPGCTTQACNIRDSYESFITKGYAIIGVSADSEIKHQEFIKNYKLPFDLIADTDKKLIKTFGAWGIKKFMGKEYEGILRYTYIINKEGIIQHIITKIKTKEHSQQIFNIL